MNYSVIRKILGKLAILLASLMLLPLIVSLDLADTVPDFEVPP